MRIAILGATSQIARDLILSCSARSDHELTLFARRPEQVQAWLHDAKVSRIHACANYAAFSADHRFDAVINFVGVGDPARAAAMGSTIFEVTEHYDSLALAYLRCHPDCRYIFLSSGAVYGGGFERPVEPGTPAVVPINHLRPEDWYGCAKLNAECRHRGMSSHAIVDLRVFSYVSHTQDLSARFLVSDILRAIRSGSVLRASPGNIIRDYIGPGDFFSLVSLLLAAPPANAPVDCYTRAPVDKMSLLAAMKDEFGLLFEFQETEAGINSTGAKLAYYSTNRFAADFGYQPAKTSVETVIQEARIVLAGSPA